MIYICNYIFISNNDMLSNDMLSNDMLSNDMLSNDLICSRNNTF